MGENVVNNIPGKEKRIVDSNITCAHCDDGHIHTVAAEESDWKSHVNVLAGFAVLAVMLVLKHGFDYVPDPWVNFSIHALALLLAGGPVLRLALRNILSGNVFNEFVLMSVAAIGAFYIGAYNEGLGVMVFYSIGEWFQDSAVNKAKRNIKALLDIRPETATVLRENGIMTVHPFQVNLNEVIRVRNGEKVALDGVLLSDAGTFNASALTGESIPVDIKQGTPTFAGMINAGNVADIRVTASYKDSAMSRILAMVQDAAARKSTMQLFISRFAKIYTPVVFFIALCVCFGPVFFVKPYSFDVWFYRALIFLVISCPCALVISIPLGYFGGIGLASRNGILFKGGNYLDVMAKVNTIVMDKTGTLTKGIFKVHEVHTTGMDKSAFIALTASLEKHSTHPVAQAIVNYAEANSLDGFNAVNVTETAGRGLKGFINNDEVIAGNLEMMKNYEIAFPASLLEEAETIVAVAVNKKYCGHWLIADEIKTDAARTIKSLRSMNIKTMMLSGDKISVVKKVAAELHIGEAYGDLLPEDKLNKVSEEMARGKTVAFAGDGINDAPVIALADVGIAMGGLGSHAAIETADVVIQNDQPHKIVTAIRIGRITRAVVWQNIVLAMSVKAAVMILGAGGMATLWEAVIADVGVALLAVLNAIRIQRKKF
jgi:Zn2+/Cd2+-exporting ATPase